ncbi:hypothetical protein ACOSQ3_022255 [Xanthoceras sorbifolium]
MIMSWTWTTLVVFAFLFLLQAFLWKRNAKAKRLPPGPRGFPIFECLHLLGKYPHRDLHKLARKYGTIMHLRLGLKPTIVVSSPQAAELFLRTHDLVFASRPPLEASKYMAYNQKNLVMAPYGSYWRNVRKMCIAVDLSAKVGALNADMTCRMVFGKKYMEKEFDERGFKDVMEEIMELLATINLADYIPQIASLDLQGLRKRMKVVSKVFDAFLEKIIDEHVHSKDDSITKDFVDLMLSFMGSEETEYLQNELENVVGKDKMNDPDNFYPERFAGSNIDLYGRDFQLIPFAL